MSRLARQHVKVSLTGHGGDELFAGYPKHFGAAFGSTDMFDLSAQSSPEQSALQRLRRVLRQEGLRGVGQRLGRRLRGSPNSFGERWISAHCGDEPARNPMLHPGFVQGLAGYSPRESYLQPLREAKTNEALDQVLYHDLRVYLQDLLAMEDRMSMAVSLESRVPLLDHRIVELIARIPPTLKVSGRQPKRLLREVVRPLLPASVLERRDKSPFPIPVEQWFNGQLFGAAREVLTSPRCLDRGVFNPDRLREDAVPPAVAWQLINMESRYRIFVDREPHWVAQASALTTSPLGGPSRSHGRAGFALESRPCTSGCS